MAIKALPRTLLLLASATAAYKLPGHGTHHKTTLARRQVCAGLSVALSARPLAALSALSDSIAAGSFSITFTEKVLGLDIEQYGPRVRVARVKRDSPAFNRGVPPYVLLESVNGETMANLTVESVQAKIRQAVGTGQCTLGFDRGDAYTGLAPDAIVEKAAGGSGFETARVKIEKANFVGRSCGFESRESDIIEVDYTARLANGGAIFDSTASRGRPFAALLGNGDIIPGLELGLLEMCIGEVRTIEVPPALGFGARGSRTYQVPPDSVLLYEAKLVSINGITDPNVRREDLPDEQRF